MRLTEALFQVLKPPFQLVCAQTALVFASSMQPGEDTTDDEPAGWAERDERWTIDTLLGLYDPQQRQITIFTKGIEYAASQLHVPSDHVKFIVRIHEWAHAVFHLGVDQETSTALAKASLAGNTNLEKDIGAGLTQNYKSVESYVHEQIAQTITSLALQDLRANASADDAQKTCAALRETFTALTARQPPQYRLDHLQHLSFDQLRSRVRALIGLMRFDHIKGEQRIWDTIMPW
jgi:hypothetical protein